MGFPRTFLLSLAALAAAACAREERLAVTATAFNSTPAQTDGRPRETACGTTLVPGEKAIAVSRDLKRAGLDCGMTVRIGGLEGNWTISDVTAARHHKLIDIYMGQDIQQAREWGSQEVEIRWRE